MEIPAILRIFIILIPIKNSIWNILHINIAAINNLKKSILSMYYCSFISRPFAILIISRPTSSNSSTCTNITTSRFCCGSSYYAAYDLSCARVFDFADLMDYRLINACTYGSRCETCACNLAHDASDGGMDGDFSSTSVVLHVMCKIVGFLTEYFCQFLPLLNGTLVKDFIPVFSEISIRGIL